MPLFTIPINHTLGQEEALKRIKLFASNNADRLPSAVSGLEIKWVANTAEFRFAFNNIKVNGEILINNNSIQIKSKVPLIFYPLKSQITKMIKNYADTILI